MTESPVAHFYDQLADDYHLIYADWDASVVRQGGSLDTIIRARLGEGARAVLDCACGIGTQAIGLALRGHRVTGSDISRAAVGRAVREAAARGVRLPAVVADMRQLPFNDGQFDVVVCADNSLPHLLTEENVCTALAAMRRVLRNGGLLLLSTRPYDEILASRPAATPPSVSWTEVGRTIGFQLWDWHDDGEHYDLEHFQLVPDGDDWYVRVRRVTYWALGQRQLTRFVTDAGFSEVSWESPESSGFFQPVLIAR
ncbi:class I SAM-dependent methyltransferase [Streptomyces sp. NBC_00286]|uniref:class I SAM-dependent methyltransferase n=1 Tax=Streptomyces sp. NBC_00286 TaxID=2975701 RepID=UPI002E2CF221|nr:methyltransferase domain-containing protein [Streptomyces sp. NBC_00286]